MRSTLIGWMIETDSILPFLLRCSGHQLRNLLVEGSARDPLYPQLARNLARSVATGILGTVMIIKTQEVGATK